MKAWATPLVAVLALVIAGSGLMLFFHWSTPPIKAMHRWLALVFVAAIALHATKHARGIRSMLAQNRIRLLGILALAACTGFLLLTPPQAPNPGRQASQLLLNAPITQTAALLGLSKPQLLTRLRAAGNTIDDAQADSIDALARANHCDPMRLLSAALDAPKNR